MRLNDRSYATRRAMWGIGSLLQIVSYGIYLVLPFTVPVVIANIVLFAVGAALAGEPTYKVFSQELFPTMLRGTAQGFTFGVARTLLGVWSFFVPILAGGGDRPGRPAAHRIPHRQRSRRLLLHARHRRQVARTDRERTIGPRVREDALTALTARGR